LKILKRKFIKVSDQTLYYQKGRGKCKLAGQESKRNTTRLPSQVEGVFKKLISRQNNNGERG